ncbi:MAG TPA: hypothetical protein VER33_18130, partial [Polyangiaceae bacterium]|nr:hypothetical protein [Polyangiaceae bacterium]
MKRIVPSFTAGLAFVVLGLGCSSDESPGGPAGGSAGQAGSGQGGAAQGGSTQGGSTQGGSAQGGTSAVTTGGSGGGAGASAGAAPMGGSGGGAGAGMPMGLPTEDSKSAISAFLKSGAYKMAPWVPQSPAPRLQEKGSQHEMPRMEPGAGGQGGATAGSGGKGGSGGGGSGGKGGAAGSGGSGGGASGAGGAAGGEKGGGVTEVKVWMNAPLVDSLRNGRTGGGMGPQVDQWSMAVKEIFGAAGEVVGMAVIYRARNTPDIASYTYYCYGPDPVCEKGKTPTLDAPIYGQGRAPTALCQYCHSTGSTGVARF